ncbi:SDR family oxidoreductase [Sciscionella sediminilitoris]|uniref:SDR family oxidoreductase n=1 Tax=Sciscionella sediminilitoris TaxID=1445613 RepID=UPI0004DF4FF2|nr:SDR family oxidoreductase [Sciscionella sp. SE31]
MAPIAVTGSASGIGAATAETLRAAGHEVIGIDLRDAEVCADLGTRTGREGALAEVLEHCAHALDGFVSCAGLGPHIEDPALISSVNYFGAVAMLDGLFPALRSGTDPAAVVVSSVASVQVRWAENPIAPAIASGDESAVTAAVAEAGDYRGHYAYAAAKNALTVAVRRRAGDWGTAGVRLNTVAPGVVDTPLLRDGLADERYSAAMEAFPTPIGRRGQPRDVATLIAYLLSAGAGFVHGAQFVIDGGADAVTRPEQF